MPSLTRQELATVLTAAVERLPGMKLGAGPRLLEHLAGRIAAVARTSGSLSVTRSRDELYWTALNLQMGGHAGKDLNDRKSIDPMVSKWKGMYGGGRPIPVPGSRYDVTLTVRVERDVTVSMAVSDGGLPVAVSDPQPGAEPPDPKATMPDAGRLAGSIGKQVAEKLRAADPGDLLGIDRMVGRLAPPAVLGMFRGHLATFEGGGRGKWTKRAGLFLLAASLAGGGVALGIWGGKLLRRQGSFSAISRVVWDGEKPCLYLDWRRSKLTGHFVVYRNGVPLRDVGVAQEFADCESDLRKPARYNVVRTVLGVETSISGDVSFGGLDAEEERRHGRAGLHRLLTLGETRAMNDVNAIAEAVAGRPVELTLNISQLPASGTPRDPSQAEGTTDFACSATVDFGQAGSVRNLPCSGQFAFTFPREGVFPMTVTFERPSRPSRVTRPGYVVVWPPSGADEAVAAPPNAPSR